MYQLLPGKLEPKEIKNPAGFHDKPEDVAQCTEKYINSVFKRKSRDGQG